MFVRRKYTVFRGCCRCLWLAIARHSCVRALRRAGTFNYQLLTMTINFAPERIIINLATSLSTSRPPTLSGRARRVTLANTKKPVNVYSRPSPPSISVKRRIAGGYTLFGEFLSAPLAYRQRKTDDPISVPRATRPPARLVKARCFAVSDAYTLCSHCSTTRAY